MKDKIKTRFGHHRSGFSFVEIMVAVVVLAIGLIGMALMTVTVIRSNRMAKRQTEATNLAQSTVERLKDAGFPAVGNDSFSVGGSVGNGDLSVLSYQNDLNSDSEAGPGSNGPYPYSVLLRVCDENNSAESVIDTAQTANCNPTTTLRTQGTICPGGLGSGEKMIRVLVSWYRQDGYCRFVDMETIVIDTL